MIRLSAVIELEGQAPRALAHESTSRAIIIGRDPTADFQIPLSTISRQHVRISETDGVYVIEDLGSTHGTVVNNRKLAKGEKKVLRDGDLIELTKARIKCTIEGEKLIEAEPGEGTKAIAARAVQGILGRLGEARSEGPFFRVLNGPDEGARLRLGGGQSEWHFGRSKDCELVLNDPNVSRRHARVKKDWNGFTIEDLGSKNGVIVNEQQIKRPRRLRDRDEITIGPMKLVFIDPDAELLDALKDVPGFALDDAAEQEPMEAVPSHMGAPDAPPDEAEPSAVSQFGEPMEMDSPGTMSEGGGSHVEEEAAEEGLDIDPALLEKDGGKLPVEWIVTGLVGVVIVVSALLLFAIIL